MEETDYLKNFTDRFRELLEITDTEVKTLSLNTGLACSAIYAYLNGKRIPFLANALKISDYFQCPLDFLFGFCENYKKKHREIRANVHERFKTALDNSGKSHYRISKEIKINQSDISAWYLNKRTPSLITLVAFAEYLGVSLDYLAGRE